MDLRRLSESLSSLVAEISASVVTIYTVKPSIEAFLGLQPLRGAGSGFAIGEGLIATNYHVIGGASEVEILYADGAKESGDVVAFDPSRDIALVAVERSIKPLRLGDSDALMPGELVLVVGSPLGLAGPSISLGVVSAVGRTISDQVSGIVLEDLIQTDAAINPGNSGGPMVNMAGEAVGMTTAMIAGAQGIGFAIPINSIKRFITVLRKFGRPIRAWIGVYVAPLTPGLSSAIRAAVSEGVIVMRVVPGTPAHRRGLREGDIIVKARGRPVRSVRELREAIEDSVEEGCVELEIVRERRRLYDCVPIVVE